MTHILYLSLKDVGLLNVSLRKLILKIKINLAPPEPPTYKPLKLEHLPELTGLFLQID
jgi:hypothetical protein